MKKITKLLLPAALGIGLAGVALAQTTPPGPGAPPTPMKRERPSPEFMQRMMDGRIAMITGALKLNEAQQKLWAPVEAKMRENQAERMKRMQQMGEMRQQQPGAPRPDMMQRMERMNQMMAERTERQKAFLAVFKPFYESLSDEQKQVAGPLMAQAVGGGKGGMRGHRGGMHHGMMMHRGPGGPGGMRGPGGMPQ